MLSNIRKRQTLYDFTDMWNQKKKTTTNKWTKKPTDPKYRKQTGDYQSMGSEWRWVK